eukprot:7760289-Pyramimonas_sp.AAC.1
MVQDVTTAIVDLAFKWKASSLECMLCGPIAREVVERLSVAADKTYKFKLVQNLLVLGVMLSSDGDTTTSVDHRLGAAEKSFWCNCGVLKRAWEYRFKAEGVGERAGSKCSLWIVIVASFTTHVLESKEVGIQYVKAHVPITAQTRRRPRTVYDPQR